MSEYSKNYICNNYNNSALFYFEKGINKKKIFELEKLKNGNLDFQKSISEKKLKLLSNYNNNILHGKRNMNSLNNISLTLEYKKGKSPSPKKIRETLSPIMNNSNMSGKSVNDINKNINKKNNENKEKEDKNKNKKNSYKDINTSPFLKAKQPAKSNRINNNSLLNSSKIDKKKKNYNNNNNNIKKPLTQKNTSHNYINNHTLRSFDKKNEEIKLLSSKKNSLINNSINHQIYYNNFNNINNNNIRNHNNLTKINKQNNKKKVKSNSLKKDQLSIKQKPFEKEIENSNSNSNENERIITPLKATLSTRRKTGENSSKKEKIIYSNNISQSSIFSYNKIIKEIKKIETLTKKGYSGKGIKKINQDNYFIYKNFTHNPDNIFLGVCDGHGIVGHEVSYYIINNLPYELNKNFLENKINEIEKISINKINEIIEKTFNKINEKIINDPNIETTFSGSTCCSVIITPSKILCANVGDSRAILGKKIRENFYISKEISHDHKPNEKLEKNRILKNGGRVESYKDEKGNLIGPERVWKFNEDIPGLAMSRSFGDEIAHCVGVVCNPEILEIEFEDEDKFLIVASDGIWEFISSDEAVEILKEFYEGNDIENGVLELYKEASKRWIFEEDVIDDITLIVVFFD
jgi:serine/threonine protein phosphatase PrpC